MPLKFHRDSSGDPRAHGEKGRELLAQFLESDVQGSAALGHKIVAAIDKIASGHLDDWERTGNAYTLTLSPKGAHIEAELDEDTPALHLPLAELRDALSRWVDFVGGE